MQPTPFPCSYAGLRLHLPTSTGTPLSLLLTRTLTRTQLHPAVTRPSHGVGRRGPGCLPGSKHRALSTTAARDSRPPSRKAPHVPTRRERHGRSVPDRLRLARCIVLAGEPPGSGGLSALACPRLALKPSCPTDGVAPLSRRGSGGDPVGVEHAPLPCPWLEWCSKTQPVGR